MGCEPIHHSLVFGVTPDRVYRALVDSEQFAAWSGAPADLGRAAGDAFACFGELITGRHIELTPSERIVQAWRVFNWPPGAYSIVRFELAADGDGTRLEFEHAGFPPEHREHLDCGWSAKYWEPLRKFLT